MDGTASPRIGVMVVAYNAATTLPRTLDRIPRDMQGLAAVLISDDHSADDTTAIATQYADTHPELPITVVFQPRNLGYGGNQKFCYRWAMRHELDIVVLLHGDGQYAPELLPEMAAPIVAGEADMVSGSRMMTAGAARAGGMPLYKFVGNRILTTYENAMSGLRLSEWHSGYRAFSIDALQRVPFEANSDDFDFDTEILLQMAASESRISEIAIPTHYGDEVCYVDGMSYAKDVVVDVTRMRLARMGFGTAAPGTLPQSYEWKPSEDSSHSEIIRMISNEEPGRLLDLGCASGDLLKVAEKAGHEVVGIDYEPIAARNLEVGTFIRADLDKGLPEALVADGPVFDIVVAADVLEHLRQPDEILRELHAITGAQTKLIISIPNFSHWYPRLRIALGRFDYDRRGILDAGHVRFFTERSFVKMVRANGWDIESLVPIGIPFDVLDRGGKHGITDLIRKSIGRLDRSLARVWPAMFAYQYIIELRSTPEPTE